MVRDSPFLKARGKPGPFSAADLAVNTARALIEKQPFTADKFDQVVVGCVMPSEEEANIARIIALRLGCGIQTPAWTVQRNCGSGLQAIDAAAQSIASGQCDLVLAGGTEAMSRSPLLWNQKMVIWLSSLQSAKPLSKKLKALSQIRPSFFVPIIALLKGLTDPVVNMNMGQTAEELAYRFNISRQDMDEFAADSHQRVRQGLGSLSFEEITPIYGIDGTVYEQDDGVRGDSTPEKLSKLRSVFEKYGKITAGNSSQISDGAAFVILASEEAVKKYHLKKLARIVDIEWAALDPSVMGLGPVHAIKPILQRNQLTLKDIDQLEINEAFAAQVLACVKELKDVDREKLNPQGGAIAMGHPVGASGARLTLHCAKMMEKNHLQRAIASMCIGGGQGGAILLERVQG